MTVSRSDRPYGQFPRGEAPESVPPPDAPRRVRLRERIVARLRAPLALLSLMALSWFLVSAVQTGGLAAIRAQQEQPTPAPTPQLAAAIYAHVAPSVVQVGAKSASGEPSSGAGVIVDDHGHILTSLHIIDGASELVVAFSDGTSSPVEACA